MFVKIGVASFLVALFVLLAEGHIVEDHDDHSIGTKWAVLVAGSNYWYNYRHQDYTGKDCNAENFYGVILGNKSAITGGSGKVLNSGPNDYIFIYYTDHGGPGVIAMPEGPMVYAKDLNEVLKKKHAARTYKKMVIYMEACESGSMFDGLLDESLNIYVTTASKPDENSWATYCSYDCYGECPPKDYKDVCLGDLYSVSWLENSDSHDRRVETLKKQYRRIRKRVLNNGTQGSHMMEYGDLHIHKDALARYMGSNSPKHTSSTDNYPSNSRHINQRNVQLLYFWSKFQSAPEGSIRKIEAYRKLNATISEREQVDKSVRQIGQILFGVENGPEVLNFVRPGGQPLVDDWDCLKSFVKIFESHCGSLTSYGRKHVRGFANICNAGIQRDQMTGATKQACSIN